MRKTEWPRIYCEHFVLIGAMNPCPCGYYGDPVQECTCSNAMVTRYQKRISGPLLDRIDIHIEVPRVEATLRVGEKLSDDRLGEPSAAVRVRVERARARQAARFKGTRMLANADMGPAEVREYCRLDDVPTRQGSGRACLLAASSEPAVMQQHPEDTRMSARPYHGKTQSVFPSNSARIARILELARTMARKAGLDLAGSEETQTAHLAKASRIARGSVSAEKADAS